MAKIRYSTRARRSSPVAVPSSSSSEASVSSYAEPTTPAKKITPATKKAPAVKSGRVTKSNPTTGAQEQATPKRKQVSAACSNCRKRKSKCDGARPACATCSAKSLECEYDTLADETREQALKRKLEEKDAEIAAKDTAHAAAIAAKDTTIAEKDFIIADLDRELEEIDSNIAGLKYVYKVFRRAARHGACWNGGLQRAVLDNEDSKELVGMLLAAEGLVCVPCGRWTDEDEEE